MERLLNIWRAAGHEMATEGNAFGGAQQADEPYRFASDCCRGTSDAIGLLFDQVSFTLHTSPG